ncbi:MAG: polysaccharide deacetylase family protein [Clostridiales bacterium]|nr:polysaccharide deacetylase family protein [Clostridiales bacterium]
MFRKFLALCLIGCLLCGSALASERPSYITQYTNGSREEKRIAVTIDDWYEPEMLPDFLDVANEFGCKLTLYPIGINVRPKEGPAWQRAIDEGHEIGNHSNTHKNLEKAGRDTILAQLNNMEKRLEEALGHPHIMNTVRYPFGAGRFNGTRGAFAKAVFDAGYSHVALWDIDSTDAREILKKVENGSIILLHGRKKDLRTLKAILPELQSRGYEMVTISDLLHIRPEENKDM